MPTDLIGHRNLRDLIEERARLRGDATFLIFENKNGEVRRYSYAQFNELTDKAASSFASLGIQKGDKVTVYLGNCPEFLLCWFGLAKIGAVAVPSNIAITGYEMTYVVNHSDSKAIVTQPDYVAMIQSIMPQCSKAQHLIVARSSQPMAGTISLTELMANASGTPPRPDIDPEDDFQILFTSGTTSRPKGALFTHANALRSGERMSKQLAMRPDDINLTSMPLFHGNGQSVTVLSALTVGATVVVIEAFSATKFWRQVRTHKATCLSLVPMLLRTVSAQPVDAKERNHNVRTVFFAINVTDQEKASFEQRFGVELVNGYGMTEVFSIATAAPLFGEKRWPSIGLPTHDREIKIVSDAGEEVPVGEVGEIVIKGIPGHTIMKGYYKDPGATAAAVCDAWFHTGDNGYMDARGYIYFYDRKKDVIKRGAENVSASEVERVLMDLPDVVEVAVIGVPDPIRDEAVKAFVVLREGSSITPELIQAHCASKLAKFKVPTFVELRSSLPKTSIGKIEKKALRAEALRAGSAGN
jgi:crotonobetaine/carnitine-CoA ligase